MSNKYDERYDIRLANQTDIDSIMKFIDTYWKKGHILACDRRLFEYEFLNGNSVNMLIAIDRQTQEIEGIFGFLYCSSVLNSERRDIWGSLWMVVEEHDNIPFLGIELAKRIYKVAGCRMHIGSGANPKTTIPLRRLFFSDKTARMKQYYCLNPKVKEYKVCDIKEKKISEYIMADRLKKVIEIETMNALKEVFDVESFDVYPYKDNWYIEKRYFEHPYYRYKVYGLQENKRVTGVIIAREIEVEDIKLLRIVDYLGEHSIFGETGKFWHELMQEKQYEYIDFYEFGMEDAILKNAGFVYRDDADENIIPNYFEPFLKQNVDIWVHYKFEGTTFFKGDCDQDRPNICKK